MKPISPCKNCNKRTSYCHSECSEYINFKDKMKTHNDNYRKTTDDSYVWYPKNRGVI